MIRVCIGGCKSGKTWRLKAMVAAAVRDPKWCIPFIVFDVKHEWPLGRRDKGVSPLTMAPPTLFQRARSIAQIEKAKRLPPLTIYRPRSSDIDSQMEEMQRLGRHALARGRVVLVLPEIWRWAPEGQGKLRHVNPPLAMIVREHGHKLTGLWCDSQSIPEFSKEVLRRAEYLIVHGTGAHADLKALRERGGKVLPAAVLAAAELNDDRGPGHHVVFRQNKPRPPYHVRGPDGQVLRTFAE